jgi:hypothetical protein
MQIYDLLFWCVQTAALLAVVLAYVTLVKRKLVTNLDIVSILAPIGIWFCLMIFGNNPKSLANLIELFALFPLVAALLVVRTFFLAGWSNGKRSFTAFASGIVVAVALYDFVPLLPE